MSQAQSFHPTIRRFIDAMNSVDGDALMASFADDAFVNDNRREFWGKAAIRKFVDREMIGDKVTMAATETRDHHGMTVVHAKIDGEYDKAGLPDPLILTFYFLLDGDRIATLFIVHNREV